MAITVQITMEFTIGKYGWTEVYYKEIADATRFDVLEKLIRGLADRRAALCGAGVFLEFARLSDVRVRRDADLLPLNRFTIGTGVVPPEDLPVDEAIKAATGGPALNPNVGFLARTQGDNLVYHGEHVLSGMPKSMFQGGERLNPNPAWSKAFSDLAKFLTANDFLFPVLGREPPNQDRPVTAYNPATQILTVENGGLVIGDRVRLINWTKPKSSTTRSFVSKVLSTPVGGVTLTGVVPVDWSVGPKSILHREERIYVTIGKFIEPTIVTHRIRGRPLQQPRGRRSRR